MEIIYLSIRWNVDNDLVRNTVFEITDVLLQDLGECLISECEIECNTCGELETLWL